ncbi:N-acetylmuramoyl-L-alanine amidase [Butyrivibrio sp. X503]|nr:N-acetylmuramoyl-L-alanine amidase [Butyrivibrio sp. X503]
MINLKSDVRRHDDSRTSARRYESQRYEARRYDDYRPASRRTTANRSAARRPEPRRPEPRRYDNNRPTARKYNDNRTYAGRSKSRDFDEFDIRPGKRRKNKLFGSFFLLIFELLALAGLLFIIVKNLPISGGLDTSDITETSQSSDKKNTNGKEDIDVPSWVKVDLIDSVDQGNPSRTLLPLDGVEDIVIHYTANPGTSAAQNRSYFNDPSSDSCSHFIVGIEGEAILCVPLNERSAATNHRNNDTISIEVCHQDETGQFTDASYDTVIKLTKWLMDKYNLNTDHVIRHYDVTGKECPRYFVQHPDAWEQLKEDLKK